MAKVLNYSDEELLDILRKVYEEKGYVLCDDFKASNGLPSYGFYSKKFGSWNNAKKLAGVPINKQKTHKTNRENMINQFKDIVFKLGYIPTQNELSKYENFPSHFLIYNYFKDYEELIESAGYTTNRNDKGKYKKEFLLTEIKRFAKEFGRIPVQKDFENLKGYPSRKTFSNHFGSFNNAIEQAGFEPTSLNMREQSERVKDRCKKETISKWVFDYIEKYNKTPTRKGLDEELGFSIKDYIKQTYGTWNNCLIELGLPLNSVSHYDDDFLHSEFERFVATNGRTPTYIEFNNSEYPSFWCYQSRFGSWNKAVIAYGYEPNDSNRKYYMDDGEICASSYEFDISTWLKQIGQTYIRNVKYIDFIPNYKGRMDCDYVLEYKGENWYVEMAGFLGGTDFKKYSKEEKNYFFKLMYKKKLLKKEKLNYLIIEPCDLKKYSLEEIFSKIFSNKDNINN